MGVHKNFAIFTGKHLVGVFFIKVTGLNACNFIKKRLRHTCFPVKFPRILRSSGGCFLCVVVIVLWVLSRCVNRKFSEYTSCQRTYSKNYCLKVFLKYLVRLIYHCRIKNLKKLFNFIFYLFCVKL